MNKEAILTKEAPAPIGPYSQAIKAGNLLFCSGQIPLDPATNQVVAGDVKAQTVQVMKNVAAVLKAGGASFENIAKTTIFLKNMSDFPLVNEIYGTHFSGTPGTGANAPVFPARSTVEVARLPKDVLVEIEVLAVV